MKRKRKKKQKRNGALTNSRPKEEGDLRCELRCGCVVPDAKHAFDGFGSATPSWTKDELVLRSYYVVHTQPASPSIEINQDGPGRRVLAANVGHLLSRSPRSMPAGRSAAVALGKPEKRGGSGWVALRRGWVTWAGETTQSQPKQVPNTDSRQVSTASNSSKRYNVLAGRGTGWAIG